MVILGVSEKFIGCSSKMLGFTMQFLITLFLKETVSKDETYLIDIRLEAVTKSLEGTKILQHEVCPPPPGFGSIPVALSIAFVQMFFNDRLFQSLAFHTL